MNRPTNLVQLKPEDQKQLDAVGDFWTSRVMRGSLWRETDGTLWADPVEYAEWSTPAESKSEPRT